MFKPIKLIDIEISEPLADIRDLNKYQAVLGLLKLYGEPLGQVWIPVTGEICASAKVRVAILEEYGWPITQKLVDNSLAGSSFPSDPQSLVETGPSPSLEEQPLITVVVCTRDRTSSLACCLESLTKLEYSNLELLVVDNAPSNWRTRNLVKTKFPQIRYVLEPNPGLDWARNRAIEEAQGEIIAYTDDDVEVDRLWVMALARAFVENPSAMCVTGLVLPAELETEAQWLFEQYGGFGRGFEPQWFLRDRINYKKTATQYGWPGMFGTGANMAFRKDLFSLIGKFDEALDVGTVTNGGGDLEMFFRVQHKGYLGVYEPKAMVRHYHRKKFDGLKRQLTDNGIGFTSYLVRTAQIYPSERYAVLRFWVRWLINWPFKRLLSSYLGREHFPRELINAELWGFFKGIGRYRVARRNADKIRQASNKENHNRSKIQTAKI